ncbi:hypothetical protein O1611_g5637 [Lasiodiplodia mahajangana]|uniref:Uncharacterized protein n=1 Tax=Lasiodiplodia mahajangana TaxID=1108764 RepID=A0ACC2JKY1_9PEZI|nr:hypothetical protein O1611_g5637 [Lasiodiplodia mahajangana]
MRAAIDTLISLLIPTLVAIHLVVAPYTKVEESFNIQATHDILAYGLPTKNVHTHLSSHYDHFDFPGAVPRTFLGPVLLAGIGQPLIILVGFEHAQLIVRGLLGIANSAALLVFKRNIERAFGRSAARWYALLQATQFHIIFYASRPLPNMFAFSLTTLAFSQLVPHPNPKRQGVRFNVAIALLTMATTIFSLLCSFTLHIGSDRLVFLAKAVVAGTLGILLQRCAGLLLGLGSFALALLLYICPA